MWETFREVRVLTRVEEVSGTCVRKIAAAEGVCVPLVRKVLHDKPSLLLTVVQRLRFANVLSQNTS
jgi:hypothetical protein